MSNFDHHHVVTCKKNPNQEKLQFSVLILSKELVCCKQVIQMLSWSLTLSVPVSRLASLTNDCHRTKIDRTIYGLYVFMSRAVTVIRAIADFFRKCITSRTVVSCVRRDFIVASPYTASDHAYERLVLFNVHTRPTSDTKASLFALCYRQKINECSLLEAQQTAPVQCSLRELFVSTASS